MDYQQILKLMYYSKIQTMVGLEQLVSYRLLVCLLPRLTICQHQLQPTICAGCVACGCVARGCIASPVQSVVETKRIEETRTKPN